MPTKKGEPRSAAQKASVAKANAASAKAKRAAPKRTISKAAEIAAAQEALERAQAEAARAADRLAEITNGEGRPTGYKPSFAERARRLCLMNYTNEDLARAFEVSAETVGRWIAEVPQFRQAIYMGREGADEEVFDALQRSAKGYEHDEDDIRTVSLGNNSGSQIVITPTIRRYPPNMQAVAMWAANRTRWKVAQAGFNNEQDRGGAGSSPQEQARAAQEAINAALTTTTNDPGRESKP